MGVIEVKDACSGWSMGSSYAQSKSRETEIKQGKNYYISSVFLTAQQSVVANVFFKVIRTLPPFSLRTPLNILCNVIPFICLPVNLICAAARQKDYPTAARAYNRSKFSIIKAPEKLGTHTIRVMSFLIEHGTKFTQVALLTGTVALIGLGKFTVVATMLLAVSYEIIDSRGFVPRKISLFIETYLPIITSVGGIIEGIFILRIVSAVNLTAHFSSSIRYYIHQKVDFLVRHFFNLKGPSLQEIEAPVVEKRKMNAAEIHEILDSRQEDYEINPAHCNKSTISFKQLAEDRRFERFLPLFDKINWESKYPLLLKKLKDDDRFLDTLIKKFPKVDKKDLKNNTEHYIQQLALDQKVTPQKYLASWTREQMVTLIAILQGKKRVKGSQRDLEEAIQNSAKILPFLTSLHDQIEFEDTFLHFAIEGGAYCGRGIKRATHEIMQNILQKKLLNGEKLAGLVENYEREIQQTLQNERYQILLNTYQHTFKSIHMPNVVTQDVHNFDHYRNYFGLGFLPLTKYERNEMGVFEIGLWEIYHYLRPVLYSIYKKSLDEVIREKGDIHFANYMRQIVNDNLSLSAIEKEEILEKFTERNQGKWSIEQTHQSFHRLMFVMLGILRRKKTTSRTLNLFQN